MFPVQLATAVRPAAPLDNPLDRHVEGQLLELDQVVDGQRVVHVEADHLDLVHPEVPVDEDLPGGGDVPAVGPGAVQDRADDGVEVGGARAGQRLVSGQIVASGHPRGDSTEAPRGEGTLRRVRGVAGSTGAGSHAIPAPPRATPEGRPERRRAGRAARRPGAAADPRRGGQAAPGRRPELLEAGAAPPAPVHRVRPAAAEAGRALPVVRTAAVSPVDLGSVVAHTLANGLRVRVLPDRLVPAVSYYTFFGVGSRNERPGLTGISHLFEHMMFNGSERFGPKEFDRVLEAHGGASNAYTSTDLTAYHDDFASEALPVVVDLESDRMRALRITDEGLAQERSVVMEERRLRTENSHFGLMEEQLESLVYQAHPYRWPVIGWMDDIARISRADCLDFFGTYYAPGNAAIYVCGDVDPDDLLARIESAYGAIPAGPPVPPPVGGEPPQRGERRATIQFPANAPAMLAGFRGPSARERDTAVLDVLQACLSMGEGSRLRRRIVQELEVAVSVGVGWTWRADPGVFMFSMELAPGASQRKAERALWAEIDRVGSRGVSEREMARARALLRSGVLHELSTRNGVAHAMGQAEALLGDWREAGRALERYAAVSSADVRRAARRWLDPSKRNVVWLEPEATE